VVGPDKLYPFMWAGRKVNEDDFLDGMFDSDLFDKVFSLAPMVFMI
jgi:hypothetical protein